MGSLDRRRCVCRTCGCGTVLARDNRTDLCFGCSRHHSPASGAPLLPDSFWHDTLMQAARETRDMGVVCRTYRKLARVHRPDGSAVHQSLVAAWIGVSQVQICRIEKGDSRVRDLDRLIHWARCLNMPTWYAWFEIPNTPDEIQVGRAADTVDAVAPTPGVRRAGSKETDVKRRLALTAPLAVAANVALSGGPWERLALALDNPARVDEIVCTHLQHGVTDFYRQEEFTPARHLAAALRQQITRIATALSGGAPAAYRSRLLSAVGEALALYGWFMFDLGDSTRAEDAYAKAEAAARDANDLPLLACILGYRSYLTESRGRLNDARKQLVAAQAHTRSAVSATTRSWLAGREAEVLGALGAGDEALRALDRATTVYDYAHPTHERAWTAFFTASRLGSMSVTTLTRLDHPTVHATAEAVVASLNPTEAKIKAVIFADLATAAVQRSDFEAAADLANRALSVTLSQEASLGADRLRTLRTAIAPNLRIPVLAHLDERLATL